MPHSLSSAANFAAPSLGTEYLGTHLDQLVDRPEVDQGLGHLHGAGVGADEGHLRDWMGSVANYCKRFASANLGFLLLLSAANPEKPKNVKLGQ